MAEVIAGGRRHDGRAWACAIAIFAALSIVCAIKSEAFLTADACSHYLCARFSLDDPKLTVDVWGRPFVTLLYALPARWGGRLAVRMTSLALALLCAAVTARISREQGIRRPVLAGIFTLAQPLVFLHSFSEMTELPFAALIACAFWAYQNRKWGVTAMLVGLTPLARPEGFGFFLLAAVALIYFRRPIWLVVLVLPILVWDYVGWVVYGRSGAWWHWLIDHWPYAANSLYPPGHPLHFVALLPAVVSPFILPAMLIGLWLTLREALPQREPSTNETHSTHADLAPSSPYLRHCRVLTALLPLMVLGVHSLLYWLGKLGSFGEARYLLVAAPFWAILSARGWEWAFDRLRSTKLVQWAAIASLVPILANFAYPILPLKLPGHWLMARQVASQRERFVREGYPLLLASHPGVVYFMDQRPTDRRYYLDFDAQTVSQRPPGVVLVYDPVYSVLNADPRRSVRLDQIRSAGWIEDEEMNRDLQRIAEAPQPWPTVDDAAIAGIGGAWHVFRSTPLPANTLPLDRAPEAPPQ